MKSCLETCLALYLVEVRVTQDLENFHSHDLLHLFGGWLHAEENCVILHPMHIYCSVNLQSAR